MMPAMQVEYETLDKLCWDITWHAEKRCRKLITRQVSFSPELQLAMRKNWALTLLKNKKMDKKVSSHLLARTMRKGGSPQQLPSIQSGSNWSPS